MLRPFLLAGAMTVSICATAQTAQAPVQDVQRPATSASASPASPSTPDPISPAPQSSTAPTVPAPPVGDDAVNGATAAPDAALPRATTPASITPAAQVVQIVDAEFPAYDTNKDGVLDGAEFAVWMNRLKAAEPDAGKTWNDAAFAQADADRSSTLSKAELTGFLSGGVAS